jgi:hypothetical protein
MALNTNPFVEGIDPSSTFGGYASVLLQLIRQAQPSSTYGMILFDTTAPDVSGANAWRKRCLWLDLTVPSAPTVNVYKESPGGWVNVQQVIPNGTIVTAMISNAAVTLAKLSSAGGSANQLIRVNAAGNAFEFVSISNLIANGTVNVGALNSTGLPAGQFKIPGVYGAGVPTWYSSQDVIDNLAEGAIAGDYIAPAANPDNAKKKYLTSALGDTFAAWRFIEPNRDIAANSINGDRLTDLSVPITKLVNAPSGNRVLMSYGGSVDWRLPLTVQGAVTQFVTAVADLQTIPALTQGTTITMNHTLGVVPLMFRVTLYCHATNGGYDPGDEIDLTTTSQSGLASDAQAPFMFYVNGSTSIVVRKNLGSDISILHKTTNAYHTIGSAQLANWRIRLYAMAVAS